ncbi:MAG: DUF3180 domain-containing protein [Mycobacteriales bacterium]
MRPTRLRVLLLATVLAVALGYLLAATSYAQIPPLPALAPVSLVLLAVVEGALSFVVRGKIRGRSGGRPMHALQVARAAVLAKASSLAGALIGGVYGGIFGWTFGRRGDVATYGDDARVAGLAAGGSLLFVVAALLLERACRTPDEDRPAPTLRE